MADLDGTTAFVTGAGSGLGREIALTFARAGARVAVNDLRAAAAADVAHALGASLACEPLVGDVSDSAVVRDGSMPSPTRPGDGSTCSSTTPGSPRSIPRRIDA